MKASSLVVIAIALMWVNPVQAAGPLDHTTKLKLKLSFPSEAPAGPRLLDPGTPLKLLDGTGGSGATVATDTQAILAVILSFVVSFGTGHFVLGDPMAVTFLALEAGLLVALIGGAVAATVLASSGTVAVFAIILPVLGFGFLAVRIWELVDIVIKATNRGGVAQAAILAPAPALVGAASALQPMAANGPLWRF